MRGQRLKQTDAEVVAAPEGGVHRRLRVQAPPDPVKEVARAHQESLGS